MTNVSIVDFAFRPASVSISANDQVKWTWVGAAPHSSSSDTGLWDSGDANTGFTFTNTFRAAGNFPYHCDVHPEMHGSVMVQAGDTAPIISTQPKSQNVVAGNNVTLSVSATGVQPLTYQWQFNAGAISAATDSSLTLNNVQFANAGNYSVVLSNALGVTPSSNAVLSVTTMKGGYNGLFFDPNGVTAQTAGSVSIATTTAGKYSGKLQAGKSHSSFAGQFDSIGSASNSVPRANQTPLAVVLQVNADDADEITGSVSDGVFTVPLAANRAVFDGRQNVAPQAGRYTAVIFGANGSNLLPDGDSYMTVSIDKSGKAKTAGSLADNTKISQLAPIAKNGDWPFEAPLYSNLGLIIGWLNVSNGISGDVAWLKPAIPMAKFYPAGFNVAAAVTGQSYQPPAAGVGVLNFTNGTIVFNGGGLSDGITNSFNIDARNKVTNLSSSSNRLSLTFKAAIGTFSGRVSIPGTTQTLPFSGVLLQETDEGRGFVLGNGQTGEALVSH